MSLLDELTPSESQRARSDKALKEFENELQLLIGQKLLPNLAEPHITLAGSNLRETVLAPITHLNLLLVIDPTGLQLNEQDLMVYFNQSQPSDPFLEKLKNPSGLLQPALLLQHIHDTLKKQFTVELSYFRQSIHITLKKSPIKIKLTPAIPYAHGYFIPEERSELLWNKIDPIKEKDIIHKLNNRHSGNIIAAIRCMKYWNHAKNTDSFRGYHLEAIACLIYEEIPTPITSLLQAVDLFAKQMSKYIYNCPDPVHMGETLHRYLPDNINQWYLFMNRIGELQSVIDKGEKELVGFLQTEFEVAQ